jgi:hypothetical protein
VDSTVCTGSAAAPTAPPGNLCIYTAKLEETNSGSGSITDPGGSGEGTGSGTTGAVITFLSISEEEVQGWGTWAVTAEEE